MPPRARPRHAAGTVEAVTDAFHPARDGRCPRCSAGGQETNVFCVECGLRLRPGSPGLQAPARLLSQSWMKANPARADYWLTRGGPRSIHWTRFPAARTFTGETFQSSALFEYWTS